ncbi:N-methyl-L-tryptophan oxidase [Ornithinibacillus sp. 4-3]|uniref:N-methyl-L-tryptophan oxidase n=1 Tax=Ornithinibacillus sp. 4-3 TaxID=3231488 RepID=A0AB39HKW1_9BACI
MDAEVGVIGVGSMGSMAVWQLARKGVSVIGFEQFGIGHDRGAAGGDTRIFRTAYKEGADYVPILLEAYQQWRALEIETGKTLLTITKGLMGETKGSEGLENVLRSVRDYSLEHEVLSEEMLQERYPQIRAGADEVIIEDGQAGFVRSQLAILAAVDRARELGASVLPYTTVEKLEEQPDGKGVKITANGKEYTVGKVIITAGPWINEVFPLFKENIEIRRLVGTWYPAKQMEQFSPENMPVISRISEGYSYYGIPSIDGTMVKMSFSATPAYRIENTKTLERNVTLKDLEDGKYIIENFFSGLYSEPNRLQTFMEGYTTDGHPIIGKVPDKENIIVGCGFSGHGFKMASAIGKILSDIATDEEIKFPLEKFSPQRFL